MGETLRERPGGHVPARSGTTSLNAAEPMQCEGLWRGSEQTTTLRIQQPSSSCWNISELDSASLANRGSLRNAHEALVFLEEAAAVATGQKFTGMSLYAVGYKELLSRALPGAPVKQAPRMYTMLAGLEEAVLDSSNAVYSRMYSWWILVQTWCTLRFSDHRGISPRDVKVDAAGLSAVLRRSKTIGAEKSVVSRPLVLDAACCVSRKDWLTAGWRTLQEAATFDREVLDSCFLCPACLVLKHIWFSVFVHIPWCTDGGRATD